MTGYLSTIEPGTFFQIGMGLFMSVIYGITLAWSRPFIEKRDNVIAVLSAVLLSLTFLSAFLMKSQKQVEDGYEANGIGVILIALTVAIIITFVVYAWHSLNDLSKSSDTMAGDAFKNSIGTRSGSNMEGIDVNISFDSGLEMKERKRGSGFRSENPMHRHVEEEEIEGKKKKKGFLSHLSDDLAKRRFDREMKKKPANKEAQEMDEKEGKDGGVPGPPPCDPPVKKENPNRIV